jgi:hypothetical protein
MRFVSYEAHRPVPNTGWLVMNGRVRLRIPLEHGKDKALKIMHMIGEYTTPYEWAVVCEWSHCYYVTIKEYRETQATMKEYCKKTGWKSVINCETGEQRMMK